MRYADDVFNIPDYELFAVPAEVNGLGGALLHLRGTLKTAFGTCFVLAEETGAAWVVFASKALMPAPNGVIDVYCVYEGFAEALNIPACSIVKSGAVRTADGRVILDPLAQNESDIVFDRKPASVPDPNAEFNENILKKLSPENNTSFYFNLLSPYLDLIRRVVQTDDPLLLQGNPESVAALLTAGLDGYHATETIFDELRGFKFGSSRMHKLDFPQYIRESIGALRISEAKAQLCSCIVEEALKYFFLAWSIYDDVYQKTHDAYVESRLGLFSNSFDTDIFTVKVPRGWVHTTQGNFEYFYAREIGNPAGGYLYISTVVEEFEKQDLLGYYNVLLEGMTGSDIARCANCVSFPCEIAGQPGFRFSYTVNGMHASGFMLHVKRHTLVLHYIDSEADPHDVDRVATAALRSVRFSFDKPAKIVKPVIKEPKKRIIKSSPTGGREVVRFGHYEHNEDDELAPIEWLVLERRGRYALLLTRDAIDSLKYNTYNAPVVWQDSHAREWLNDFFFDYAFSEQEQAAIISATSRNFAERNPEWTTDAGPDTEDRVFLLSHHQVVNEYFKDPSERCCGLTPYAAQQASNCIGSNGYCWYWLRSPGKLQNGPAIVLWSGSIDYDVYDGCSGAIRPAIWVDTELAGI